MVAVHLDRTFYDQQTAVCIALITAHEELNLMPRTERLAIINAVVYNGSTRSSIAIGHFHGEAIKFRLIGAKFLCM